MRLFASIRPSEEALEHLVTALRPIRDAHGPMLRWTDPDQWHLTVAFYGERPDGSVDELADHLRGAAAAAAGPLDVHLRGAGSFSGRTLWVGVGGDTAGLRRLMAACAQDPLLLDDDAAPSPAGPTPEDRRRAHLTVARLRARERGGRRDGRGSAGRSSRRGASVGDRRHGGGVPVGGSRAGRDPSRPARHDGAAALHEVVHALSVYAGPSWAASEIELVSSRLGEGRSGGALHETVATIPLGR